MELVMHGLGELLGVNWHGHHGFWTMVVYLLITAINFMILASGPIIKNYTSLGGVWVSILMAFMISSTSVRDI